MIDVGNIPPCSDTLRIGHEPISSCNNSVGPDIVGSLGRNNRNSAFLEKGNYSILDVKCEAVDQNFASPVNSP